MTRAERQLLARIERRAANLSPDVRRRLLEAYRVIREALSESEMVAAIRLGNVEALIDALLSDEVLDPSLARLRALVDQRTLEAGATFARDLPPGVRGVAFDALNPNVVTAVRALDTRVIGGIKTEIRETVRAHVQAGIEAGTGPRAIARGLRPVIGMAPNQEEAVRNFRRMLEEGNREALTRKLRDRRFDRTLQKALGEGGTGLSKAQVDRMADAYRKRMIAFNAETHARSVALDSQRMAQRLSWEDAIGRGVVDRGQLRRTWITVGDDRVRPEHVEMEGEETGFDEPYSNGQTIPGETDYNCRCIERITVAEPARASRVVPAELLTLTS